MLFSATMLAPAAISLVYADGAMLEFVYGFFMVFSLGLVIWLPVRKVEKTLQLNDGFIIVVMLWSVLGLSGAVPLYISPHLNLTLAEASFEAISALTTTGATTIVGLDQLPHSILFYRQELQWLGGMGIIVLAVAILPLLGVGGMALYRAETPGPVKSSKLTPRIAETAKALWYIYLALTVTCAAAFWAAGMGGFDAISHSFSTVAIGGFSTHDQSIGYFDSRLIESITIIFMLASGVNFGLHFAAWRSMSIKGYLQDDEFRFYFGVLALVAILSSLVLYYQDIVNGASAALFDGIFHAVSIGTTTGFTTAEYHIWPGFIAIMLLMASFIGGCSGSTGGGMKVIRFVLLVKQGRREIIRMIHPRAILPVRINHSVVPERVINAVWGFFALYVASFVFMYLALALTGLDLMTAFSSVAACMNNLGPGLADVGSNYTSVSDTGKWILCFAMLLGRLEVFTVMVLLSPEFWRK